MVFGVGFTFGRAGSFTMTGRAFSSITVLLLFYRVGVVNSRKRTYVQTTFAFTNVFPFLSSSLQKKTQQRCLLLLFL